MDNWTDKLSEYVDGELDAGTAAALDRHLAECDECRAIVDDLRVITSSAAALGHVEPGRDLWAGIAAGIGAPAFDERDLPPVLSGDQLAARRRRSITMSMPQLAAAALVILALGAAIMSQVDRSRAAAPVATNTDGTGAARTVATVTGNEIGYDAAIEQLEQAAARNRDQLDTSTVRILNESMTTIDRALAEARAALAQDPANAYLHRHLDRTMKQKLEILRRAATLDRGGV